MKKPFDKENLSLKRLLSSPHSPVERLVDRGTSLDEPVSGTGFFTAAAFLVLIAPVYIWLYISIGGLPGAPA